MLREKKKRTRRSRRLAGADRQAWGRSRCVSGASWLTRLRRKASWVSLSRKTSPTLMNQLAQDLNDSRLDISRTLNQMQADGLLTLHRARIEIPLIERLLM